MKLPVKPNTGPFDLDHFYYADVMIAALILLAFVGTAAIIAIVRT